MRGPVCAREPLGSLSISNSGRPLPCLPESQAVTGDEASVPQPLRSGARGGDPRALPNRGSCVVH